MDFLKQASADFNGGGNESDLMKQAEGFLSKQQQKPGQTAGTPAPAGGAAPAQGAPASGGQEGNAELRQNAQTLYQGIQDKLTGKSDVSDQQMAGAADEVLKAAQSSGFLGKEGGQYGDYFTKAEGYLGKYAAKGGADPSTAPAPPTGKPEM